MWIVVAVIWGICALIFPKLPSYDETMASGEVVAGKVLRVETVENITINDKHPKRVVYQYGEETEASMLMALSQSAKKGQALKIRVLDGQAYPEGIRPLAKPKWLKFVLIGGVILGCILMGLGILRLLIIGGVLFAAGKALTKQDTPPPPPPPAPGPLG